MLYLIRKKNKKKKENVEPHPSLELIMDVDFDGDTYIIPPWYKKNIERSIKDLDSNSFVESNKKLFKDFKENVKY